MYIHVMYFMGVCYVYMCVHVAFVYYVCKVCVVRMRVRMYVMYVCMRGMDGMCACMSVM